MRTSTILIATLLFTALLFTAALAEDSMGLAAPTKVIDYDVDGTACQGQLYLPAGNGPFPGVLICHAWMGIRDNEQEFATRLSSMGYAVFCGDMYGVDVHPDSPDAAGKAAGAVRGDRALFRRRMNAALDILKSQPGVDTSRLAAIGFCFGGTGVLELARSGADVQCVVSFHGGLDASDAALPCEIHCKVLACHGADDPHVTDENVAAFEKQMRDNKVDWQLIKYGGAVHAFTDKDAGDDANKGAAYNADAARRSFQAMLDLFSETIDPK